MARVAREVVLLAATGAGPTLTLLQQLHPTWAWVGPAEQTIAYIISAVGYLSTRLAPSPPQQKLIDSLRPPAPEKK